MQRPAFGKVIRMGESARSRTLQPFASSSGNLSTTAGMRAAQAWLSARGLSAPTLSRWHASILLGPEDRPLPVEFDERVETRFRIEIYSEEWGYFFCHHGQASWIRVTDIPFVHGRDDFKLLPLTPRLADLRQLLRNLEQQHGLTFRRDHAVVRTNVANADVAIRRWVQSL